MKYLPNLILAVMVTSCATTAPLTKSLKPPYQFIASDRSEFDFKYEKFYLTAPASSDTSAKQNDQAICEKESTNYVAAKGQGYQVIKSFGTSDGEQITQGTLTCLHKAGWKVSEFRDGKISPVGEQEIFNRFMGGRK